MRRLVSILVLAILTALPVSGAVCTALCESAASASEHHSSARSCEESARPSTDAQIYGVSEHDCGSHDAVLLQTSATAAGRTDWGATSILATATVPATFKALTDFRPHFKHTTPPGTAPPTTTPLVLRV